MIGQIPSANPCLSEAELKKHLYLSSLLAYFIAMQIKEGLDKLGSHTRAGMYEPAKITITSYSFSRILSVFQIYAKYRSHRLGLLNYASVVKSRLMHWGTHPSRYNTSVLAVVKLFYETQKNIDLIS